MLLRRFLLTLLFPLALQAQGSQDLARSYYEESQAPGLSAAERQDWLRKSVDAAATFTAHYELGKARRLSDDLEGALTHFQAAFRLAAEDRYLAQAAYQIGITWHTQGQFIDARQWLRRSLSYQDHPEVRTVLKRIELLRQGTVISSEEILRELRVTRSFKVARAELPVHFEVNQARLDPSGRRQAQELGLAMSSELAPEGNWVILGHTDRQCPRSSRDEGSCDRFNFDLSARRAQAVRNYLVDQFTLSGEKFTALACGRQHPMSRGHTAEDHELNRRVVVMAVPGEGLDRDQLCRQGTGIL